MNFNKNNLFILKIKLRRCYFKGYIPYLPFYIAIIGGVCFETKYFISSSRAFRARIPDIHYPPVPVRDKKISLGRAVGTGNPIKLRDSFIRGKFQKM